MRLPPTVRNSETGLWRSWHQEHTVDRRGWVIIVRKATAKKPSISFCKSWWKQHNNEKELLIKANWSVLTSVCGIGSENFYLELERLIWKRRPLSAANGAVFNQPRLQMTAPVLSFRLNYGEFFARLNFLPDHSGPHHHHHHPSQHLLFRSKRALMTQRPYQSFNDISLCSLCSLVSHSSFLS